MIVAMVAIGLAGCSSGEAENSADSTRPPKPPSKAEFVKQANAVCRGEMSDLPSKIAEYKQRIQRVQRVDSSVRLEGTDIVHLVYLPTIETQLEGLRVLDIPPGEEERIEEAIDATQYALDEVAIRAKVPSIAVAARSFARADRLLEAYGLDACAARLPS